MAAIRSVIDYSAPCLPGLNSTSIRSVEVVQNTTMRAILGAPKWTSLVTMREECGLPSLQHRILARTCIALATTYLRRWPTTSTTTQLRQAFQRPPAARPDGDWMHAVADAARALNLTNEVLCEPDLPHSDYLPPPPWSPVRVNVSLPHTTHPKALDKRPWSWWRPVPLQVPDSISLMGQLG